MEVPPSVSSSHCHMSRSLPVSVWCVLQNDIETTREMGVDDQNWMFGSQTKRAPFSRLASFILRLLLHIQAPVNPSGAVSHTWFDFGLI